MKQILGIAFFIAGLCVLAGLGIWQLQRAEWKSGIIKELESEYARKPFSRKLNFADINEATIQQGYIEGRFIAGKTLHWPKAKDGVLGFYLMHPFLLEEGQAILVNIGWVQADPDTYMPGEMLNVPIEKEIQIDGIARKYEAGRWTLSNNPAENKWYKYNPQKIAHYLDLKENLPESVFFARQVQPEGRLILGNVYAAQIYPRDNHYQYAAFWFSLLGLWGAILGRVIFKKIYTSL